MDRTMKQLGRYFIAALALVAAAACQKELETVQPVEEKASPVFVIQASVDVQESRAFLDETGDIFWNQGDALKVFQGTNGYKFTTEEEGLSCKFSYEGDLNKADGDFYALYPYTDAATIANGVITTVLPSEQTAAAGSFGKQANLAVAFAPFGESLTFKNAAAFVKVSFKTTDENAQIKKITIRSVDENVLLSGNVTLTPTVTDGVVTDVALAVTDGVPYVSVVAEEGALSPETDYYLIAAPAALAGGYRVEFTTTDGLTFTKDYTGNSYNSAAFKRNTIAPVGRKNLDLYEIPAYVRLTYANAIKKKTVGDQYDYIVVYKMAEDDYRILNQRRTQTNVTGLSQYFGITTSQLSTWVLFGGSVPSGIADAGCWVFSQAFSPNPSSKIVSGGDNPSYQSDNFILLEDDEDVRIHVTITSSSAGNGNTKGTATVKLYDACNKSGDYASHSDYCEVKLNNLKISMDQSTDTGDIGGEFEAASFKEIVRQLLLHTSAASYYETAYNKISSKNTFTAGFKTSSITTAGSTPLTYSNYFMFKNTGINSTYDQKVSVYRKGTATYADFAADNNI